MKSKGWLAGLFALILLFVVGWTNYAQKARTDKATWEYKVVRNVSEWSMNQLGFQGWELVTFQPIKNEGGTIGEAYYIFKRAR